MDTNLAHSPAVESNSAKDLRRQEKIRQIVDAATEVFLEDGFSATSIDRIVARAGVSKRTLYNYYQSKDEIFIDVMQKQVGSFYQYFEVNSTEPRDLVDQLKQMGFDLLVIANAPGTLALFRNIAAEAQRFPNLAHRFLEESCEKVIAGLAKIIQRNSEKAGLNIKDAHEAAEHFLDLLGGAAYHRVIFGTTPAMSDKVIRGRTEQAIRYFLKAYQG